jgi:hypothetical protein
MSEAYPTIKRKCPVCKCYTKQVDEGDVFVCIECDTILEGEEHEEIE